MPLIRSSSPRTRQPQGARVASQFAPGLEFLRLGSGLVQSVGPLTYAGSSSITQTPQGLAEEWSESRYVHYSLPEANAGSGPWTIAGIFVIPALPASGSGEAVNGTGLLGVCLDPGAATADRGLYLSPHPTLAWRGYVYDGAAKYADGPTPVAGVPQAVVVTCDGASLVLTTAVGETVIAVNNAGYAGYSAAKFCVGNANDSTTGTTIQIPLVARFRAYWPKGLRQRFAQNPWELFAPIERRIWAPSAGGAVPSITAVYADSVTASSVVPRVTLDFA